MNNAPVGDDDAVMTEAAAWFARMRGPSAAALAADHALWLAQSPANRRAYAHISRIFAGSAVLRRSSRFGAQARRRNAPQRTGRRAGLALTTAAVLALAFVGLGLWMPAWRNSPSAVEVAAQILSTQRGEIRRFALADGSSVVLDTASRIEVRFDRAERHLRLVAGRARIMLARDERPCSIEAGAGQIATHSATLDVALGPGLQFTVAVYEGTAQVRPRRPGTGFASRWLIKGEVLSLGARDLAEPRSSPAPGGANDFAWPTGWAEYRSIPLAELVAQANRYATRPIMLDDPGLGRLEVTGRFHLADSEAFTSRLAALFDLAIVREPDAVHLHRRNNIRGPD